MAANSTSTHHLLTLVGFLPLTPRRLRGLTLAEQIQVENCAVAFIRTAAKTQKIPRPRGRRVVHLDFGMGDDRAQDPEELALALWPLLAEAGLLLGTSPAWLSIGEVGVMAIGPRATLISVSELPPLDEAPPVAIDALDDKPAPTRKKAKQ